METRTLLTTLAVVAGLFGASHSFETIDSIERYKPVEPSLPFPFNTWWSKETSWNRSLASPHIVGGKDIVPYSIPHHVILIIDAEAPNEKPVKFFCSGTLLSDSWVVTLAQCVDKDFIFDTPKAAYLDEFKITVNVHVGEYDLVKIMGGKAQNVQVVKASQIIQYPNWSYRTFGIENDIALLKLEKSVSLDGKYAKSIRLPKTSQKDESFKDFTATVSGWGYTKTSGSWEMPPRLLKAEVNVLGNFYCKARYFFLHVKSTHICTASDFGPSTCDGDRGGSLTVKEADLEPTLVGITSSNIMGCLWGFPNIFIRVTSYLDWILETTSIAPRN